MADSLRFVIVGHVDHGKSTLIGRLLFDTGSLSEERIAEIRRVAEESGRALEFAHVIDHLEEERRESLTIDTAQIPLRTPEREYTIIDAPGHREFLKNMVTGASQAQAAILNVDVAEGMREQTRRHVAILGLLGIERVILAINKMDLAGYAQDRFDALAGEVRRFGAEAGVRWIAAIPISAREGDNVVRRSERMPWHTGPTIVEALASIEPPPGAEDRPLRFPVQDVYVRDAARILVGRIEAGTVAEGDEVLFLPSGAHGAVAGVRFFGGGRRAAAAGTCPGLVVPDAPEVGRGEIACPPTAPAPVRERFEAKVFWLAPEPLRPGEDLLLRCATQSVPARAERIARRVDSSTLEVLAEDAGVLEETEVGQVGIRAARPVVIERFRDVPELGRFVLCRGAATVAGGIATGE
ncbi:MAG: 50S ribosome-binding GTPase [Planctomycetes bacterium]|nr:50S ribosome-binding GTPase [Planctomycetota bacterium]